MRASLLSSVSFVFLALAPLSAHAGFEFVPAPSPEAAKAAAPQEAATASPAEITDMVTNSVADEPLAPPANSFMDVPVDTVTPAPRKAPPVETIEVAPTATPAPAADEPMVLGRQAIPLTPVVKHSDALSIDDAPVSASSVSHTVNAAPISSNDVLWDSAPSASVNEMPVSTSSATVQSDMLPPVETSSYDAASAAISDLQGGEPVQGFGRQVPLALALQQIVPPSYRYSFDHGVDPGMRVSWTGGKPWKAIITDLARENDLNVDIVTNVVAFRRRTPMDIIDANTSVDSNLDTVQGMGMRSVSALHEAPVAASTAVSNENPMSILDPAAKSPKELKAKEVKRKRRERASFDRMLDYDTPAEGLVANKEILVDDGNHAETPAAVAPASGSDKGSSEKVKPETRTKLGSVSDTGYGAEPSPVALPTPIAPVAAPLPSIEEEKAAAAVKSPEEKVIETVDTSAPMNIVPTDIPAAAPKAEKEIEVASVNNAWIAPQSVDAIAAAPAMSAEAVQAAPAVDMKTETEWEGYKNHTLRETLTAWSERAGVSVVWSSEFDYPLQTDVRVKSTYPDAVRTLLAGFSKAQPRPVGRLFKNDKVGAQPVLVVETQRLTN